MRRRQYTEQEQKVHAKYMGAKTKEKRRRVKRKKRKQLSKQQYNKRRRVTVCTVSMGGMQRRTDALEAGMGMRGGAKARKRGVRSVGSEIRESRTRRDENGGIGSYVPVRVNRATLT